MFQVSWRLWGLHWMSTPTILPFLATQRVMIPVSGVCAFAAGDMLAINIAAADAPMSQRHAFLKDSGILVPSLTVTIRVLSISRSPIPVTHGSARIGAPVPPVWCITTIHVTSVGAAAQVAVPFKAIVSPGL